MHGLAAVYIDVNKPLEIRKYPILEPNINEARLKLVISGICGTDIHIIKGRLVIPGPLILGHEFIGNIDALNTENAIDGLGQVIAVRDNVIACVAIPCGKCFSCQRGETASCLNFGVTYFKNPEIAPHFFGGYADTLFSPLSNLIRIPEHINIKAVAAFPCAGPTIIRACAYAGGLEASELVVVQGTGAVGLFAIAWASALGCEVIAIGSGSSPKRMELAKLFGAKTIIDYKTTTTEERIEIIKEKATELNRGDGADVVIEASGAPTAVPEGMNFLRTRGRYLIPGQYSSSGTVAIAPELITFRALQLIGSGQYTIADIKTYLDFLSSHQDLQEKFASIITNFYSVDQAEMAITAIDAGKVGKAVFINK
jgi:D-arabinose 1-dehydrogenase-like Zn-dependent alcohol dehydrogenase